MCSTTNDMKTALPDKQQLRLSMVDTRRNIPMFEKRESDRKIAETLIGLPEWKHAKHICLYVSLPAEVDTRMLLEELFRQGKTVSIPKIHPDEGISIRMVKSVHDLTPGQLHILEPKDSCPLAMPGEVDVFIVPGLVFDRSRHRLGWGRGFYDRLLAGVGGKKIGLGFSCQIVDALVHEPHDVPLDMIITEKEII
jgi:5-formyltetrahydrofolate cyclo-ligase